MVPKHNRIAFYHKKRMKLGGIDGTGEHYIVRESATLHAAFQLLFKFDFALRVPFPESCGFDIEI